MVLHFNSSPLTEGTLQLAEIFLATDNTMFDDLRLAEFSNSALRLSIHSRCGISEGGHICIWYSVRWICFLALVKCKRVFSKSIFKVM